MLSRRSVRIKILQLLYSMDRDQELSFADVKKKYKGSLDESHNLFLFTVFNLYKICETAVSDESKRKTKHVPGDYDKVFTAKIFNDTNIKEILEDKAINKKMTDLGFVDIKNGDFYKKIYDEFAKTEPYKDFILNQETTQENNTEILLELFRYCRKSEYFEEVMDDKYPNWIDEKSLIVGVVKKYLKNLKNKDLSFSQYYPDKETTHEFGQTLLVEVNKRDKDLMEMIVSVIKNWDTERLAIVDTIILKLALCEMLNFTTIPAKVTINEYVEISKIYSTEKSKEFINGILDSLMKDLSDQGKIQKEGRGLVE